MTDRQPFRCVHCAYDLAENRHSNGEISCPECGSQTDPYNPQARHVRWQPLPAIFTKAIAASTFSGVVLGFALTTHYLFIMLFAISLYIPLLAIDIIHKRSARRQRKAISLTLGAGTALGIALGFALGFALYTGSVFIL